MSVDCDLPPDFYSWSEPVARKQHRCCECSAPIVKGEKHFACTGKWDGHLSSYRQHLLCCHACMFVRDKLEHECICFGGLFEWYAESKWQCDKSHPIWREFRKMLADIKRRERALKP